MRPHRLELTNNLVLGYGLHEKMAMYNPRRATEDELCDFHDEDYVDFLKRCVGWRVVFVDTANIQSDACERAETHKGLHTL